MSQSLFIGQIKNSIGKKKKEEKRRKKHGPKGSHSTLSSHFKKKKAPYLRTSYNIAPSSKPSNV
jgi:hypothetical protein